MPIPRVPYYPFDFELMLEFLSWAKQKLNLRDWDIELEYGEDCPDWAPEEFHTQSPMGLCLPNFLWLYARIWVSPENCEEGDNHPLATLSHEVCHVLFSFSESLEDRMEEVFCHRFEWMLVESFCSEKGICILLPQEESDEEEESSAVHTCRSARKNKCWGLFYK